MFALKVCINDEQPVIARTEELGLVNVSFHCSGKLGNASQTSRPDQKQYSYCYIGGLTARGLGLDDEHLTWLQRSWDLNPGDRIIIEIVETDRADTSVDRSPAMEKSARKSLQGKDRPAI